MGFVPLEHGCQWCNPETEEVKYYDKETNAWLTFEQWIIKYPP